MLSCYRQVGPGGNWKHLDMAGKRAEAPKKNVTMRKSTSWQGWDTVIPVLRRWRLASDVTVTYALDTAVSCSCSQTCNRGFVSWDTTLSWVSAPGRFEETKRLQLPGFTVLVIITIIIIIIIINCMWVCTQWQWYYNSQYNKIQYYTIHRKTQNNTYTLKKIHNTKITNTITQNYKHKVST
jgi:hypothetical protein